MTGFKLTTACLGATVLPFESTTLYNNDSTLDLNFLADWLFCVLLKIFWLLQNWYSNQ